MLEKLVFCGIKIVFYIFKRQLFHTKSYEKGKKAKNNDFILE